MAAAEMCSRTCILEAVSQVNDDTGHACPSRPFFAPPDKKSLSVRSLPNRRSRFSAMLSYFLCCEQTCQNQMMAGAQVPSQDKRT